MAEPEYRSRQLDFSAYILKQHTMAMEHGSDAQKSKRGFNDCYLFKGMSINIF